MRVKPYPFFEQVRRALDIELPKMAKLIQLPIASTYVLCKNHREDEYEYYAEMEILLTYTNERMGAMLAARNELMNKLDDYRRRKLVEREKAERNVTATVDKPKPRNRRHRSVAATGSRRTA